MKLKSAAFGTIKTALYSRRQIGQYMFLTARAEGKVQQASSVGTRSVDVAGPYSLLYSCSLSQFWVQREVHSRSVLKHGDLTEL